MTKENKKYHIKPSTRSETIVGYLVDIGGGYYNNYREDSYVVDEENVSATIKKEYNLKTSFWVIVRK